MRRRHRSDPGARAGRRLRGLDLARRPAPSRHRGPRRWPIPRRRRAGNADRPVEAGGQPLPSAWRARHRRAGSAIRSGLDRRRVARTRTTRPRMPASATTRSLPLPSRKAGTPASRASRRAATSSSASRRPPGVGRPPTRSVVSGASGTSREARPRARRRARRADRVARPGGVSRQSPMAADVLGKRQQLEGQRERGVRTAQAPRGLGHAVRGRRRGG